MSISDNILSPALSTVLTDYGNEHRPHNQNYVDGIAINPNLRPDFDMTDLNDRDPDELRDWWHKPYIVTKAWCDIEIAFETDRLLLRARYSGDCTLQQAQMERIWQAAREDWFDKYPYGIRYEVRCLDGRLPDRATIWGTESSLKSAIARAKEGPPWCLQ